MKRVLALLAIALLAPSCSSTCKDGSKPQYGFAGWGYFECGRECCREKDAKKCKCTDRCSCNHGWSKPE